MNARFKFALIPTLLGSFVFAASGQVFAADAAPATGKIVVKISKLKSSEGQVMVSIFSEANRDFFPGKREHVTDYKKAPISNNSSEVVFEKLVPGTYAIAMIHDENGNDKMDTNFIGIPTEGGGASNNPKPRMGPPLFEASKFEFKGGVQTVEISIQ